MNLREDCHVIHARRHCLACGAKLPEAPLLSLTGMPATAQDMPEKEDLAEDSGVTLSLFACPCCGLVQFDCNPVTYYREVIRAVGLSETMRSLRRSDYAHLIDAYGLAGKKWIECGCGRGEFLEVLREFPVRIYGTEADRTNADIAHFSLNRCEGCGTFNPWISEEESRRMFRNIGMCSILNTFPERADQELPGAPFDCFLSFNFLEHQPDPMAMLGCMHHNLTAGGYGLITVPSFEYILEQGRYYELIRDHIANYTMESLRALCLRCGFEVLEAERIGIGDTLRMVVRKPEQTYAETEDVCTGGLSSGKTEDEETENEERAQNGTSFYTALSGRMTQVLRENYERFRAEIEAYMERLEKEGRSIAMWGAGHQGFTAAATTALKDHVRYIIDKASFKQGKYAPASHIPIVAPEHFEQDPVDVILIAAPGYRREIEAEIRTRFAGRQGLKICDLNDLTER